MPRGMRAVPLAESELAENLHHQTRRTFTQIVPVSDVIQVFCWCEKSIVEVPWDLFRWANDTLSCGQWGCVGPDGQDHVSARVWTQSYIGSSGRSERYAPKVVRMLDRVRVAVKEPVELEWMPPGFATMRSSEQVAIRREYVEALWRAGKRICDIARALGVSRVTAAHDVKVIIARMKS